MSFDQTSSMQTSAPLQPHSPMWCISLKAHNYNVFFEDKGLLEYFPVVMCIHSAIKFTLGSQILERKVNFMLVIVLILLYLMYIDV